MKTYDLIVLGGGSGGLAAAQRAKEYGARTVVFEQGALGGTCVNVGCVPKKVMWNAAQIAHAVEDAAHYGFHVTARTHDWIALKRGRDAYVNRLSEMYQSNLENKCIDLVRSPARFHSKNKIVDAQGNTYRGAHIVVATGGYPRVPDIPGASYGITSDGFFDLEELPRQVAIVGSGYIAMELAGVFKALGSEVSLFMRFDRVLRSFDEMISERVMADMQAQGIQLVTEATPGAVEAENGLTLSTKDGRHFKGFQCVLWAIGRAPNTGNLGLDLTGIELDNQGYVLVDKYQNTSADGVYAIGDVTGMAALTPVAIAAGRRLADRVFGGQADRYLSYENIASVIFSHPPVGTVGLSEKKAREYYKNSPVRAYKSEFVPMYHALTIAKPLNAMKLVTVGEEERVVGCHVVGAGADEMIQGFAVAISMGARKCDLDDTVAVHPTGSEELVLMR